MEEKILDKSKIKNVIFDLDNTIIFDKKEDAEGYRKVLKDLGFDEEEYLEVYDSIDRYDRAITEDNSYYNRQEMLDFINKDLNRSYPIELVNGLIDVVGNEWIKTVLVEESTLEYLASKYNLYIYTNYFQEAQTQRIKNIGYLKYFQKIMGADKYGSKPFKKSFENVLKEINATADECIMIGDDKIRDIKAANNVNMKSILYDYDGKREKKECDVTNYIIIKSMKELESIL